MMKFRVYNNTAAIYKRRGKRENVQKKKIENEIKTRSLFLNFKLINDN